jgi:uracil-DNA glycosylase
MANSHYHNDKYYKNIMEVKYDNIRKIKQEIMADPMNESYTKMGSPPLSKASVDARIVIVGQEPGRKAEATQLF